MTLRFLFAAFFIAFTAVAQQGDQPGEEQKLLVPKEKIPAAPVLSTEQSLKAFKVAPGFRVELVAGEPLIQDPVAIAFDPDGRLWVVEMRGYMPNVEGKGEEAPVGRVVVLDDLNGDGRMDRSTVFLDGLVMPRAVSLVRDGVLIGEPPHLWFCRDTNGDGKGDEKTELVADFGISGNPELAPNGLLWGIDNWIYNAYHTNRYRFDGAQLLREPTRLRGQWGITQDDSGRLFYNSSTESLRGDLVPSQYLRRNPNFPEPAGANVAIATDQTVWPIRVNPGVNRGYQTNQLRADGSLATYTSACGPVIYRGDAYPPEFYGNAFVCEPTGNFVRRNRLVETNGVLTAVNTYHQAEFLASPDERFRPVNLAAGPDGCLYVVDMYRGVIQHRLYLTTYLRRQIEERGLDRPIGLGRIYRLVHESKRPGKPPRLSKQPPAEWAKHLSHPNGWWRDTAQRLLVERKDLSVAPGLRKLAVARLAQSAIRNPQSAIEKAAALGRLHALWTLEGLGQLDWPTVAAAFKDPHPNVRAAAIRLSESWVKTNAGPEILSGLMVQAHDPDPQVQLQLMLTLGETKASQAETAMLNILNHAPANAYLRDAALSGLFGRELEFLERLLAEKNWFDPQPGRAEFLSGLAQCVFREGKPDRLNRLIEQVASSPAPAAWRQVAVLDGLAKAGPAVARDDALPNMERFRLGGPPAGLIALAESGHPDLGSRAQKVLDRLTWPGKPETNPGPLAVPFTTEQQARFDAGKELYLVTCAACHQPTGLGQEGLAPPLAGTEWATGSEQRLVRIVLHGMRGPIKVKGVDYQLEMPPLAVFDDDQIAALLTYVRREWGHQAAPVEPATVSKIRAETENRDGPWTEPELLKIP